MFVFVFVFGFNSAHGCRDTHTSTGVSEPLLTVEMETDGVVHDTQKKQLQKFNLKINAKTLFLV